MTYKPGDQPDEAFTAFYAGDWQTLLTTIQIPGTDGKVSWDRTAAWLYWCMAQEAKNGWDALAVEGGAQEKPMTLAEWIAYYELPDPAPPDEWLFNSADYTPAWNLIDNNGSDDE